jgi:hypothetical protein
MALNKDGRPRISGPDPVRVLQRTTTRRDSLAARHTPAPAGAYDVRANGADLARSSGTGDES